MVEQLCLRVKGSERTFAVHERRYKAQVVDELGCTDGFAPISIAMSGGGENVNETRHEKRKGGNMKQQKRMAHKINV